MFGPFEALLAVLCLAEMMGLMIATVVGGRAMSTLHCLTL